MRLQPTLGSYQVWGGEGVQRSGGGGGLGGDFSLTLPFKASMSSSAFLAHFCQKFGSSKEISVLFPDTTKLA